jgi:hypothetical protein
MINVIVKQFGWKKAKLGDMLQFDDDKLDELVECEKNGLCSIESLQSFGLDDIDDEDKIEINEESEEL